MWERAGNGYATLRMLLADERLNLESVQTPEYLLDRLVRWVTVTEMVDPSPYLLGDELILTLGSAWPDPDSPDIEQFVRRLASAGVAAVGIGLGFTHERVPQRMIDAASAQGLPLIAVPLTTRFRSIGEYVVEYVLGDKYAAVQDTLRAHSELTEALTSRLGVEGLISQLRRLIEVPVAVIDYWGGIIANQPASTIWETEAVIEHRGSVRHGDVMGGASVYPVEIDDKRVAFLCTHGIGKAPELMRFAVSLVALELSRRQALQHGRRELIGQVLGDYVQGDLADHEAHRRLSRAGVDFHHQNRVILARVNCSPRLLEDVPWNSDDFLPLQSAEYTVALVDDVIAIISSETVDADDLAQAATRHLARLGETRIGIGGPYQGWRGCVSPGWRRRGRWDPAPRPIRAPRCICPA
ncbi:PucR family transcriptional regulator ligand-binding domain-containing protein [Leucobacter soli]|uniref:PucR family transcriptional regulator ligand-binding domain-containing protein n=1 Tax=Leucobacter soli TaxID=2812850 RepID=UPI003611226A